MTTFLRSVKFGATLVLVAALALAVRAGGQQAIVPDAYLCPMHPDVVSRSAGSCPRCGMPLALADPYDAREFLVAVEATPRPPRAGSRTRLRLTVREPSTRASVRDFVEVHEKPYHLFVISQDLEHYDHVHPQQQRDGSYIVDVTLPKPGYYKLYSDFLPLGATPQVVPGVLVTAGAASDLESAQARLVADTSLSRTAGGMRVTLTLPSDGLVAGRDEKLQYHITDAASGAPIADLEPYLAAFGHTLVLSEDTLHYVHAHPVEILPEGAGGAGRSGRAGGSGGSATTRVRGVRADGGPLDTARGGPDLTFKALMPKPGRYRVWTQLKRRGVVSTVSFTVAVASPAGR